MDTPAGEIFTQLPVLFGGATVGVVVGTAVGAGVAVAVGAGVAVAVGAGVAVAVGAAEVVAEGIELEPAISIKQILLLLAPAALLTVNLPSLTVTVTVPSNQFVRMLGVPLTAKVPSTLS